MQTSYVGDRTAQYGDLKPAVLLGKNPPSSYDPATGDPVENPASGDYIAAPFAALTVSKNYAVEFAPLSAGDIRAGAPAPNLSGWVALWFTTGSSTGSGVESVTITAGGTYTGTVPTVTFSAAPSGGTTATGIALLNEAGTAVVGVLITNPGSGYLTAPTVTFLAGGATGTAVLSPAGSAGIPVPSGTDLSAEQIQFGCFVTEL